MLYTTFLKCDGPVLGEHHAGMRGVCGEPEAVCIEKIQLYLLP